MLHPHTPGTHIILFSQQKLSLCCRVLTWYVVMQCTSCSSPQTFHLNCLSYPTAMFPETCHTQRKPSIQQQCVLVSCSKCASHCYTHTHLLSLVFTGCARRTKQLAVLFVRSLHKDTRSLSNSHNISCSQCQPVLKAAEVLCCGIKEWPDPALCSFETAVSSHQ